MDWAPTLPAPKPYKPPPLKPNPTISLNNSIFSNLSPTDPTITNDPTSSALLADPRSFPPPSPKKQALKTIFDRAFAISHPPAEVGDRKQLLQNQAMQDRPRHRPVKKTILLRMFSLLLLNLAYGLLFIPLSFSGGRVWEVFVPGLGEGGVDSSLGLGLYQRYGFALAVSVLVTLMAGINVAGGDGGGGRSVSTMIDGVEAVATAVFGGVVSGRGGEHFFEEGREIAVGQLAFVVVAVGEMVLLSRDCVRLRS